MSDAANVVEYSEEDLVQFEADLVKASEAVRAARTALEATITPEYAAAKLVVIETQTARDRAQALVGKAKGKIKDAKIKAESKK
jgi:hypothetical protein